MAPSTIGRGLKELDQGATSLERQRRAGGGRKRLVETDATLESDLLSLIGPMTVPPPITWIPEKGYRVAGLDTPTPRHSRGD
jgi:hypothetical protein